MCVDRCSLLVVCCSFVWLPYVYGCALSDVVCWLLFVSCWWVVLFFFVDCCCVSVCVLWRLLADLRKACSRCYLFDVVVRCLMFVVRCCLLVVGWCWFVVD